MKNSKQLETVLYSTVGVAVTLLAVMFFNIIAAQFKFRTDMTADQTYTLTQGTRDILKKLGENGDYVTLKFYYSQLDMSPPQLAQFKVHAKDVEDLLMEYKQHGEGNISIEKFNPQPASDAEDSAQLDGIDGLDLPWGDTFYLGLAVQKGKKTEAVNLYNPSESQKKLLEYEITRAISKVSRKDEEVVKIGIMSGLPISGGAAMPFGPQANQPQTPWAFHHFLKRDFDIIDVPLTSEEIEEDVGVLVVVHPKNISDNSQYAIDQFLMRGGKLVAFLDPVSYADPGPPGGNQMQRMMQSTGGSLDTLLKAWGLEFSTQGNCVVADNLYATLTPARSPGQEPERRKTLLTLKKDSKNPEMDPIKNDPSTAEIDSLTLFMAGAFKGQVTEGLTKLPLLTTSPNSMLQERMEAQFGGMGQGEWTDAGPYDLALKLTGSFKSAFPDGKPSDDSQDDDNDDSDSKDEDATSDDSHLSEPSAESSPAVILVGDSDLIYDPLCAQAMRMGGQTAYMLPNGNIPFALGMVEHLSGDDSLISVRARATKRRHFTKLARMEQEVKQKIESTIKGFRDEVKEKEQKINDIQRQRTDQKAGQKFILTPEQERLLKSLREDNAKASKRIRETEKELRKEVEGVKNYHKWGNIFGMPALVAIGGIALAWRKKIKTAAR